MQSPCERAQLIEQNIDFVWRIVRQYLRRYPSVSRRIQIGDLANIGVLGMIAAGRHYDASRGVAFTTFAFPRIHGEIARAVARARLVRRPHQIAPLTDQADPRQIEPVDALEKSDQLQQLERALERIDPLNAETVRRRLCG